MGAGERGEEGTGAGAARTSGKRAGGVCGTMCTHAWRARSVVSGWRGKRFVLSKRLYASFTKHGVDA
jgi:hypothetical protein